MSPYGVESGGRSAIGHVAGASFSAAMTRPASSYPDSTARSTRYRSSPAA